MTSHRYLDLADSIGLKLAVAANAFTNITIYIATDITINLAISSTINIITYNLIRISSMQLLKAAPVFRT